MAGFMDANTNYLLRTNLWSRQIKELLLDELNAMRFVRIISDLILGGLNKSHHMLETPYSLNPYLGKVFKIGQSAGKETNERYRLSLASRYYGGRRNVLNIPSENWRRSERAA